MIEDLNITEKEAKTYRVILEHYERYPRMLICDYFKLLFHSSLGCEHGVTSYKNALKYILAESKALISEGDDSSENDGVLTETLDGDYGRVYLSCLKGKISPNTLAAIFYLSARCETDGVKRLEEKLAVLRKAAECGDVPLSLYDLDTAVGEWKKEGYAALHHSDEYRKLYRPSYRVVLDKYIELIPILADMDKMREGGKNPIDTILCLPNNHPYRTDLLEIYGLQTEE